MNRYALAMIGIACAAGLSLAAVAAVRTSDRLEYDPTAIVGSAPVPQGRSDGVNLHDGRRLEQTFTMRGTIVSHVGLGLANLRQAAPEAAVTFELSEGDGAEAGRGRLVVGSLRADDLTWAAMPITLRDGAQYRLVLHTSGVPPENSLTVWHQADETSLPGAAARVRDGGEEGTVSEQTVTGNIGFALQRRPTARVLWHELVRSPAGALLAVYAAALLCAAAVPAARQRLRRLILRPAPIAFRRPSWRELVFVAAVGASVALTVTLPYYTQLDRMTTMGDVMRALVYRGVAREALLQHGEAGLWDSYLCGGEPLLANMESANFDPFFLLVLLFGENLGTRMSVTATLLIGFLGAYVVARSAVGLSRLPSLLAALLFSFSGFQLLAFANGNYAWMPIGFVPWLIYCYLRSWRRLVWVVPAALTGAFVFFGGSIHMLVYALTTSAFIGGVMAVRLRSWRPVVCLVLLGMLLVPLVGVKLLPVAGIQAVSGSYERPAVFVQPWSWLGTMFIDRDQLSTPQWTLAETGENFRWIEYGAYVGIVPVLLFGLGLLAAWRSPLRSAMAVTSLLLLLMTFAWFPWTLLHQLPLLDTVLRNPQRARMALLLTGGALAGVGLQVLSRRLPLRPPVRRALQAGVVAIVLIDLATFHNALYDDLWRFERPHFERREHFVRLHESYTDFEARGIYKMSYENYLANEGVTDMCMPYLMGRGNHASGVGLSDPLRPYRGEAYFAGHDGTVDTVALEPNRIVVAAAASRPDWLVLNQNFFPGWHAVSTVEERTELVREVRNYNGLVAARVDANDRVVTFVYRPRSYRLGLLITGVGAGVLVLWWYAFGKAGRRPLE